MGAEREQDAKENLKREKEREEMRKKRKREEEEEKIKLREKEYEKRMNAEKEQRRKQEQERQRRKKEEEEELQLLLMEIGEDFEIDATLEEGPIENSLNGHSTINNSVETNGCNGIAHPSEKEVESKFNNKKNHHDKNIKNKGEEVKELTQEISFTNMIGLPSEKENSNDIPKIPDTNSSSTEPSNVWSSLRKIKESETDYTTIFNSKTDKPTEVVFVDDIDDMIKDLAQQIADKRSMKKPVERDMKVKESLNIINNNTGIQTEIKPFNFEIWKSEMDAMFGQADDPLEKKAADELYLKNLRQKIQVSVEKVNKENKNKEKAKDKRTDKNDIQSNPAPSNVDDFALLKLKEKERKKKKQARKLKREQDA